ncbi:EAL domain-containing protein [Janthinobacterium sp. 17J80-10]|uniref:bifunctional diguanylate cyclase/phosphodiesterase n=1 Tax=Janthinobacterium sp. 17J80-10 TaxID=2497863 RepID=UPI0013E8ADAE|nr:EAL domain-containing protein [Janthinobacterium sp. 17J80-10]
MLIALVGWIYLVHDLDKTWQQTEARALADALNLAKNHADHLVRSFDTVDQTLLHIRYEWQLTEGNLELETLNKRKLFHAGLLFNVSILDREGNIHTSTMPGIKNKFLGDREFFNAQKFAIIDFLYLGKAVFSSALNQDVVHFARSLNDPDGSFAGTVMVAVNPAYFTTTYNENSLGKQGLLALAGDDGGMRATRVGNKIGRVSAFAFNKVPQFSMLWGSGLLEGKAWFADGRSRYVGWQQIEGYPLVAIAGLDQQEVLVPYLKTRTTALRSATLATTGLLGFSLIAMILSLLLAWRKHQLEQTQATYRMATEEGHEGFYIAHPVRDRDRKIIDFIAGDCNSYGARLFQQRREGVLGKHFSTLFPEPERHGFMNHMRQAMETGFYEGEMQSSGEWSSVVKWVHLKMVRADDELAITIRDISDTKAHVTELERRGNEDALTGLPNRYWIQGFLPQAIARARTEHAMLALLFIDLDGFKWINDTLGHPVGDELLRYSAERLKVAVRPHDHVVRLGGDEFVVIVEQLEDRQDAAHVAERVVAAFREKFRLSQGTHSIGTSIGISVFPDDGADADTLLKNADIAMYAVKTSGKGNFRFFEHKLYEALRKRVDREQELRQAIENDELLVHYQPRFDIKTGVVSSMEALVRWQHPVRGLIEPLEFIPLAEETGLILDIGEQVLDKVCAQLAAWARQERGLLPVSVNVSPRQFSHANFIKIVAGCLKRHRVPAHLLEIEITESCMMGDTQDVAAALAALQKLGIRFLIDDFGTGYSSLSQLQKLDFDVLKVDRSFTSEVEKTEEGKVFFTAIITMAHALGMRVVAEGVENRRQLEILKRLRCDEVQGFYVAKPLPPAERQSDFPMPVMPAFA